MTSFDFKSHHHDSYFTLFGDFYINIGCKHKPNLQYSLIIIQGYDFIVGIVYFYTLFIFNTFFFKYIFNFLFNVFIIITSFK